MDLQAWLLERTPGVEAELDRWLPDACEPPARLHAAMRHLVFPGGKRLRPAFALAAAEAAQAPAAAALPMAVAVELVHVYSLIHDDLPCMDDDSTRRGRPTVHVAFDEALAVLAGDALQSLAFDALLGESDPARAAAAARDLAAAIGASGLVGGQADDLAFKAAKTDLAGILSIHRRKTAALIGVSIVGGARLAGSSLELLAALSRFGEKIGVAFQIADDRLDAESDEGCSLLAVEGPDACLVRAESLLESALVDIEGLGEEAAPLRALAEFAVRRDR